MTIGDQIGKNLNPELRQNLLNEVLRGELLLPQANEKHLEHQSKQIQERLQEWYNILNHTLTEIRNALNYPQKQNEWEDSKPLEELLKIFPGLYQTNWWAMQMRAVGGF